MKKSDKFSLIQEKRKLLKRIRDINILLMEGERKKITIDEIANKVEEFSGIKIFNIGKKCNKDAKIAKQIFWRMCFEEGISGTISSKYTGDNSRYAAIAGREYHINKCKKKNEILINWLDFKNFLKKSEKLNFQE